MSSSTKCCIIAFCSSRAVVWSGGGGGGGHEPGACLVFQWGAHPHPPALSLGPGTPDAQSPRCIQTNNNNNDNDDHNNMRCDVCGDGFGGSMRFTLTARCNKRLFFKQTVLKGTSERPSMLRNGRRSLSRVSHVFSGPPGTARRRWRRWRLGAGQETLLARGGCEPVDWLIQRRFWNNNTVRTRPPPPSPSSSRRALKSVQKDQDDIACVAELSFSRRTTLY